MAHLFSTLCGGLWSLVFCLFSVFMGNALFSDGDVNHARRDILVREAMGSFECYAFVFNVVSLERKKHSLLKWERVTLDEVEF